MGGWLWLAAAGRGRLRAGRGQQRLAVACRLEGPVACDGFVCCGV